MSVFREYAHYYDLLYRDKDYQGEADYVHGLIQDHAPGARSILNLGCGSGRHDQCLVARGYTVTGVDISEEMLHAARNAATGTIALDYMPGDIRSVRLGKKFDAVISLFHVMSYQISNHDLLAAFRTAHEHLKPRGAFIFDCWYGPGVLSARPQMRTKVLEDEQIAVTRTAHPEMKQEQNVVDVNYQLLVRNKLDGREHEIRETHRMRYLFQPEIILFLSLTGFELEAAHEWFSGSPLALDTWNAVFICRNSEQGAPS